MAASSQSTRPRASSRLRSMAIRSALEVGSSNTVDCPRIKETKKQRNKSQTNHAPAGDETPSARAWSTGKVGNPIIACCVQIAEYEARQRGSRTGMVHLSTQNHAPPSQSASLSVSSSPQESAPPPSSDSDPESFESELEQSMSESFTAPGRACSTAAAGTGTGTGDPAMQPHVMVSAIIHCGVNVQ